MNKNWNKFDDLFKKYSVRYSVPFNWLKAICMNESALGLAPSVAIGIKAPYDIEASKSSDGKSWGIMQMTLPTAKDFDAGATPEKLNNPEYSVDLAARFLKYLMSQFSQIDPRYAEYVLKSYNQGAGNTRKEIKTGKGYADEYWTRIKRHLTKIEGESK